MPLRLLVVDDEAGIAKAIGLAVRQLGIEFQTVADPLEAVERFIEYCPDILMIDMIMPGKDGVDVLHEILSTGIPSRIVLTSGYGDTYLRLGRGIARFHGAENPMLLPKPFRREELIGVLGGLVDAATPPPG